MSAQEWQCLLPTARRAGLLARLAADLDAMGALDTVPPEPRRHLRWAMAATTRHHADVRRELAEIRRALADLPGPVVLLKGAAYVAAGLPAARGRTFTDIDIMVPRRQIEPAEAALMLAGWLPAKRDAYDDAYYRRWMHEIPPLRHVRRESVIDLHHTLVPPTAGRGLDPALVFAGARPLPETPTLFVPATADLILHASVHLFDDSAFDHALRDLSDLDRLLRRGAATGGAFWEDLLDRAQALDLHDALSRALRLTARVFATPVPPDVRRQAERGRSALGDRLFDGVLRPAGEADKTAQALLYLRGHLRRMPPHLLVPHLTRKTGRRLGDIFRFRRKTH